jgi:hypothetical protein
MKFLLEVVKDLILVLITSHYGFQVYGLGHPLFFWSKKGHHEYVVQELSK